MTLTVVFGGFLVGFRWDCAMKHPHNRKTVWVLSLSLIGFLRYRGSLIQRGFLPKPGSLIPVGFLMSSGSLTFGGFLEQTGSLY